MSDYNENPNISLDQIRHRAENVIHPEGMPYISNKTLTYYYHTVRPIGEPTVTGFSDNTTTTTGDINIGINIETYEQVIARLNSQIDEYIEKLSKDSGIIAQLRIEKELLRVENMRLQKKLETFQSEENKKVHPPVESFTRVFIEE